MTLLPLFEWLESSAPGAAIRDSAWLFPVIEAVHLLGLALLGAGLIARPLAYVGRQLEPVLLTAVSLLVATGIPLFLSEAVKCYWSGAFRLKMAALALALAFAFGVRRRVLRADPEPPRWQARATGLCSLALWLTVATAGRWIGFS